MRAVRVTVWRLAAAVIVGLGLWGTVLRFTRGLGAATNLSDGFPWGVWIGFDVLVGVGLAAGGFTITAAVHLFDLKRYQPITRPTVLTAFLGYLLVIVALLFDLGRPHQIWHPLIMWNGRSVMFEVAWCVTLYTTVLAVEFSPMLLERLGALRAARVVRSCTVPLVIVGVLLSTLHQSSLGTLYVIVPNKLYGLWYSPLLPIFFFLSAVAAGLSMVIIESSLSARAFGRRLELPILQELARVIPVVLGLYLLVKLQDLAGRDALGLLSGGDPEGFLFLVEMVFGVVVPMAMLFHPAVRRDPTGLATAALLVILGFILNRLNVAITGLQRSLGVDYFPSIWELAVTAMLVVAGFVLFSLAVRYLRVFPAHEGSAAPPPVPVPGVRWASGVALAALAAALLWGASAFDASAQGPTAAVPPPEVAAPAATAALSLPAPLVYDGDLEMGAVTFDHETHVDPRRPECASCHAGAFPIVGERERPAPRLRGEALHESCGRCHDGESAFAVDDGCESCHVAR